MNWRIIGQTFSLAAAGGVLFFALSVPLAWMLGPLAAVVLWSQTLKKSVCWPVSLRNAALVVLGYVIGKSFTAEAARQVVAQLPVMLLVTSIILGMSLLFGFLTHRLIQQRLACRYAGDNFLHRFAPFYLQAIWAVVAKGGGIEFFVNQAFQFTVFHHHSLKLFERLRTPPAWRRAPVYGRQWDGDSSG